MQFDGNWCRPVQLVAVWCILGQTCATRCSLHQVAPNCTNLYQTALSCNNLHHAAPTTPICTKLHQYQSYKVTTDVYVRISAKSIYNNTARLQDYKGYLTLIERSYKATSDLQVRISAKSIYNSTVLKIWQNA